jgi:hypothetical protein
MTKTLGILSIIALSIFIVPGFPTEAFAGACASSPITARGEESRFVWLAKTKTRANWRAKVRATTGLGPNYANWAHAQDTEERCLTGVGGTVCIFTGVPCRP